MKHVLALFTAAVCGSTLPAQISWRPTDLAGPAPRELYGLTWCPVTQRLLGFGGALTSGFANDTYAWDGQTWQTLSPAGSIPSPRTAQNFATNLLSRRVVMFGGINPGGSCNDETWEWDGTQWLPQTPANPPSARCLGAMAYGLGETYLFGGTPNGNSNGPHHTDTWRWNGLTWTPLAATGPTAGLGPAMVFDPVSGLFVLFGGNVSGSANAEVDRTWWFNGSTWQEDTRTPRPTARRYHQMVYDAGNQVVVLHGGISSSATVLNDTWTYTVDGGWVQAVTPPMPARFLFGMAHDPVRDQVVFFGGNDLTPPMRGDSWISPGASAIPFGAGCANGSIAPTLTATAPVYNSTMSVTAGGGVPNGVSLLVLGFGSTCLGGQPLPFRLNTVGAPNGCSLLVSDDAVLWSVADGAGQSVTQFSVPPSSALPGIRFGLQGATLDTSLPTAIPLLMSNGIRAKVGF